MLFSRRASLSATRAAALAGAMQAPTFELVPLKNALDQSEFLPPGATVSVTASPAKGIEATVALCEQTAGPRLSSRAASVGADDPGPCPSVRSDRVARGRGRGPSLRRRGRRQGAGRLPGRPRAAASHGRDRSPARGDRDPRLPAGPCLHRRCAAPRGAPGQGGVRQLHDDAALLRPDGDRRLARCTTRRGHRAFRSTWACRASPSRSGSWRSRAHRGRDAPVPDQEHPVHGQAPKSGGFYRPDGFVEGLAPHIADPAAIVTAAPVHVQRRRRHRGLAPLVPGRPGVTVVMSGPEALDAAAAFPERLAAAAHAAEARPCRPGSGDRARSCAT